MTEYRTLQPDEINDQIKEMISDIVDGWYAEDRIDTHEFLDRLETWLLNDGIMLPSQMDDPTLTKILRIARKYKREISQ